MATKISEMTAASTVGASDIVPILQGGENKRATFQQVASMVGDNINASNISYDNTQSGLVATKTQGAIDELATKFTQMVKTETYYLGNTSVTIPANGALNITANQFHISTPTGYTPVAIGGFYILNNDVFVRTLIPASTGTASVMVCRNTSATAWTATGQEMSVTILYVRTDMI